MQAEQRGGSAGLTRWWSKPASRARCRSSWLAVAGQRDQQRVAASAGSLAQAPRDLVAVHARQADVEHARPRARSTGAPPSACCAVADGLAPRGPASSRNSAMLSAASWLSSTTSMRQPPRPRRRLGAGGAAAASSADHAEARQRGRGTPSPGPARARAPRRGRRAARPGAAPASGRRPGRPGCGRASACPARTARRRAAAARRRCRCRCRARAITRLRRRRHCERQLDRAAFLGVLGGVVEQVGDHLRQAREVAAQPHRRVGQRSRQRGGGARR